MNQNVHRRKLLVIGDEQVGKTCLFWSFTRQEFPFVYVPSVFEGYVADIDIDDGNRCDLALWDTPGSAIYDRLRAISYPDTDIILLCFSLIDPASYRHVEEKWYNEINRYSPGVPIILVGTKLDLREDKEHGQDHVLTMEEGLQMKMKNNNVAKYMECSALTLYGLNEVFTEATRIACGNQRTRSKCLLL